MPRVHLPAETLAGPEVVVSGDAFKYLSRVLRLRPGDELQVFDGAGNEIDASVDEVGSKSARLRLHARRRVSTASASIVLLQAVAKGEKMDWIVQKTTELGVARIVPVLAARSVARPSGDARATRWQTIAREAARQSGRADVPDVASPAPLADALVTLGAEAGARLIVYERARGAPLRRAVGTDARAVVLLVGPEGGFAPEEVEAATAAGFAAVGLGPRVLRVETAALVAVALVQAAIGGLD